jgi:two-component system, OmpR family, response regulator
MRKVLLIDDDEALAGPLKSYFERFDLNLISATDPSSGLQRLDTDKPDLVILDVMLPEMDGFEVCRLIRKSSEIPIIMLTARGDVTDRVVGLELGADDYLPKPFEPRELVARIQNILRRIQHDANGESRRLKFGDLTIDLSAQRVTLLGRDITLTGTEFSLLAFLASTPGKAFTRDEILNALKGIDAELYSRAVDIAISRLRKKLAPTEHIKTVWGSGYRFVSGRK